MLTLAGSYHLEKSNNELALQFAQKAMEYDEINFPALNLGARAALRSNQLDKAKEYYLTAYEKFPDNPIPPINLASIALDENDPESAKPYVEYAKQLNGSLPLTLYIIARYANATGDNQSAKTILQDTKSGLDNFGPAIFLAGKVAYDLGELEVAAARLRRSLAVNPENNEARALLNKIEGK